MTLAQAPVRRPRRSRLLATLTGLVLAIVAWPWAAHGHAAPVTSDPADGQVLPAAPAVLTVTFTEHVSLARRGNVLLDANGTPVPADFRVSDTVLTIRPEAPLGTGTHVVTWRVVSADSHPVAGGFTFAVGQPSASAVEVPTDEARRELAVVRSIAEGVRYVGVLGLAGLTVFVAFGLPPSVRDHASARRRLRRTAIAFGSLAVAGAFVLIALTAIWESGDPLSALAGRQSWSEGLTSAPGTAASLTLVGTLVCLVALRRRLAVPAAAGAALTLASLVTVGHTRSFGPPWVVVTADLVHLAAGAVWWGGLVGLVLVLGAQPRLRPKVRATLVARFSALAGVLVAALVVAGLVLYWRIGNSVVGLWETGYGRAVLLKCLVLVPVLGVAWWNRRHLVGLVGGRDDHRADRLLRRTLGIEVGLIAVVLAVTAVLVAQTPPARSATVLTSVPAEQVVDAALGDSHRVRIVVTPARRGTNVIQLVVTDANGVPVDVAEEPVLRVGLDAAEIGPFTRPVTRTATGRWESTADLPLAGAWTVDVTVRLGEFEQPIATGTVQIP